MSFSYVTAENFEETFEMFIDTFVENPGNPVFKALKTSKAELSPIWRKKLEYLVQRSADPTSGLF